MRDKPHPKLAILYDESEKLSPSNLDAINYFIKSGKEHGFEVDIIKHYDIYRLHEYDALFIRTTTSLMSNAFWLSKTAHRLGLVVIDDYKSIEIGSDKIAQFDLFKQNNIPTPRTFVVDKNNYMEPLKEMSPPMIFKNPYSSFSKGIYKIGSDISYRSFAVTLFQKLQRFVIQEFIETDFDWRIGILNGEIIFACKYYMTIGNWKIIKHNRNGDYVDGKSECVAIKDLPTLIAYTALKAAALLGNGLYGVDIKEKNGKVYVIEVNDNPNIDEGIEDELQGQALYDKIILHFRSQIELSSHRAQGSASTSNRAI